MARGTPSLMALLGLLAVAGYQNRDKLAEMLGNAGGAAAAGQPGARRDGDLSGILSGFGNLVGGAGALISNGLQELVDKYNEGGRRNVAESWITTGPNAPVTDQDLESAIGSDALATLTERTGLSRAELLRRLSQALPDAVDRYTPDGRIPGIQNAPAPRLA